jgi:hypothetical protein
LLPRPGPAHPNHRGAGHCLPRPAGSPAGCFQGEVALGKELPQWPSPLPRDKGVFGTISILFAVMHLGSSSSGHSPCLFFIKTWCSSSLGRLDFKLLVADVPGLVRVSVESPPRLPGHRVDLDAATLHRLNLNVTSIPSSLSEAAPRHSTFRYAPLWALASGLRVPATSHNTKPSRAGFSIRSRQNGLDSQHQPENRPKPCWAMVQARGVGCGEFEAHERLKMAILC